MITPAKRLSGRREQGDFIIIEAGRLLALQIKKMALRNHQRRLGKKHFTSVIWSVRRGTPLKEQSRIPRIIDGSVIGLRWQSRPNDGRGQQRGTGH